MLLQNILILKLWWWIYRINQFLNNIAWIFFLYFLICPTNYLIEDSNLLLLILLNIILFHILILILPILILRNFLILFIILHIWNFTIINDFCILAIIGMITVFKSPLWMGVTGLIRFFDFFYFFQLEFLKWILTF